MDSQLRIVVFNEAELLELVHKVADPGTRCADHLGQGFLTDPGDRGVCLSFVVEVRKPHQSSRQALFAVIEQVTY